MGKKLSLQGAINESKSIARQLSKARKIRSRNSPVKLNKSGILKYRG